MSPIRHAGCEDDVQSPSLPLDMHSMPFSPCIFGWNRRCESSSRQAIPCSNLASLINGRPWLQHSRPSKMSDLGTTLLIGLSRPWASYAFYTQPLCNPAAGDLPLLIMLLHIGCQAPDCASLQGFGLMRQALPGSCSSCSSSPPSTSESLF